MALAYEGFSIWFLVCGPPFHPFPRVGLDVFPPHVRGRVGSPTLLEKLVNVLLIRYSTDYGMFHFCIADSEHDWREGTEQYQFIERCLASADRRKQPWLIFAAHRVLGYSSACIQGTVAHLKNPWEGKACRGFCRSTE
ncbi:putative inactive purple acid phosphatase 27 [Morella rubra]|uniref:Putative inactive purple acid phosphatase 27 n=1 Tax=Morella rubra TaxID=262757 RepID=A0A6A1VWQ6_9ROSI|nr:putative inactive purple acid phosphatase 27 [Morella rubra]